MAPVDLPVYLTQETQAAVNSTTQLTSDPVGKKRIFRIQSKRSLGAHVHVLGRLQHEQHS